jgi:poly-gamma-glutamate capsule biosynthesis protein CapA/YwtB (metallophosphatase superfamily)
MIFYLKIYARYSFYLSPKQNEGLLIHERIQPMKLFKLFFSLIVLSLFLSASSISQDSKISMLFGGDCTFANSFETCVKDDFTYPFKKIRWITEAEITMVNLENPVSLRGTIIPKKFNFRMNPKYLNVLKDAGVDIVTCANNHSYDYGRDALFDTMHYLDSVNIKHTGVGKDLEEARKPVIFNLKNKKIAFISYHGGGDWYPASKNSPGVLPRNTKIIEEDIKRLKEIEKVDYIIVNYHWGEEGSHKANGYQINLGHFTIDAGADIVIGHHPHVLQGIEKYKNGIIAYSLGNFIFGGNSRREYDTMMIEILLESGKIIPKVIPIHVSSWQADKLEGKNAERVINNIIQYSKQFKHSIF